MRVFAELPYALHFGARPKGEELAKFPEQMPFQEWQHSDYATNQTCQDCHMPW